MYENLEGFGEDAGTHEARQEIEQCGRPAPAHPHLPIQQPEQSAQT